MAIQKGLIYTSPDAIWTEEETYKLEIDYQQDERIPGTSLQGTTTKYGSRFVPF